MRILLLALMALLAFPNIASAQDEGLYDPVAPEGSAFFRFIHADNNVDSNDTEIKLGSKSYGTQNYKNVSDYFVRKFGDAEFSTGDKSTSTSLEADKYYSIIKTSNDLIIVEDSALENSTKALLTLYNLTDEANISLKTSEKEIDIIKNVTPKHNGSREINAVELTMTISSDTGKSYDLDPIVLERQNAYSIIVLSNDENDFFGVVRTAKTDTTK